MDIQHSERDSGGMFYAGEMDQPDAKLTYRKTGDTHITIVQTFVSPPLRGNTIGKQLVEKAAKMAEAKKLKIRSSCWFATEILEQSNSYRTLLE